MKQPPPDDKKQSRRELLRAVAFFSQVGFTISACVLLGVLAGRALDNWLGTTPWLLLLFSLLGVGAALKALFDFGQKK
ncbi:MAG: AtpZ/AtpI family protein [Eubacteriales bacterium]